MTSALQKNIEVMQLCTAYESIYKVRVYCVVAGDERMRQGKAFNPVSLP